MASMNGTHMAGGTYQHEGDSGLFENPIEEQVKPPRMFKVVLLNDDFTPMDYVVDLLIRHFAMGERQAEQVMWDIHHRGRGSCGVFTREVAETKTVQINQEAQRDGYPLKTVMEEA